jgi:hypothetical protein
MKSTFVVGVKQSQFRPVAAGLAVQTNPIEEKFEV